MLLLPLLLTYKKHLFPIYKSWILLNMMDVDKIVLYQVCLTLVSVVIQTKLCQIAKKRKKQKRSLWSRQWLLRRDMNRGLSNMVVRELQVEDPSSFKNFTRMSVKTFYELLLKVEPFIRRENTILRESISAETRLLVTLRFLATGETYKSLHYGFRISVPALSKLIPETIKVIYSVLKNEYLTTPMDTDKWEKIAEGFYKYWNFPNCLGALDGKHIAFRAKKEDGSYYFNYKGFHSIVLMALVDAEYNFIYVDVGCNGKVSDGGVYNNSSLCKAINNNQLNFPNDTNLPNSDVKLPYVIVADDAFRLCRRIMKPWGLRITKEEKIFNYRLSRARRVVENAFGILANRFQILQKDINLSVDKVEDITLTCCVLHNFIKRKDGKQYFIGHDNENTETISITPGRWRENVFMTELEKCSSTRPANEPLAIRKKFTDYFNGVGFVPWQWEAVKKFNF